MGDPNQTLCFIVLFYSNFSNQKFKFILSIGFHDQTIFFFKNIGQIGAYIILTWNDVRKKIMWKKIKKELEKKKGCEWHHGTWNVSHDVTLCDKNNLESFGKFIPITYDVCLASYLHH